MIRSLLLLICLTTSLPALADRQGGGGWLGTFLTAPTAVFLAGESIGGHEVIVDTLDPVQGRIRREKFAITEIRPDYMEALERSAKSRNWEYVRQ